MRWGLARRKDELLIVIIKFYDKCDSFDEVLILQDTESYKSDWKDSVYQRYGSTE